MKTVMFAPYARNHNAAGGQMVPYNLKSYPYWGPVVRAIRDAGLSVTQLGVDGDTMLDVDEFLLNRPMGDLRDRIARATLALSVDTWLHHAAHALGVPAVVVWTVTDPLVYGYRSHTNLIGSGESLTANQFGFMDAMWAGMKSTPPAYVTPAQIVKAVLEVAERRKATEVQV